ncbi:MAG: hypothetical protein ACLQUY_19905 [Ktedonobacterales bacterium]
MRPTLGLPDSRHAKTDLYDEKHGTFLVQYPIWFVTLLALAGVLAFALAGFLGYTASHSTSAHPIPAIPADAPFLQPWELFLWFCALMVTLLVSIFRDKSLRGRLVAILVTACLAIIIVGTLYFSQILPDFLKQLLRDINLAALATEAGTYAFINFLLIGIFWLDTVRRWVRRSRGLPPSPRVDIGWGSIHTTYDPGDMPTLQELISGDLIAGAVLTLILAFLFDAQFLSQIIHTTPPLSACTVSWPFGACTLPGGGVSNPPTLSFIDVIQALIYLPLGLIILALAATLSGLGAVRGVGNADLEGNLPAMASADRSSAIPIAVDVSTTVWNTLKAALSRRLRLLFGNLVLSLRMVGWPCLIFFATYGLAQLSTNIQYYLHDPKNLHDFLIYVLPALIWGVAALLGMVFSAALLLFRWRVADNTLRFLGLIGFVVLLTFWIFSLALWGFNQLLLQTGASSRHPFDPPSITTLISVAAILAFGILWGARTLRGQPVATKPAASTTPVTKVSSDIHGTPASASFSVSTPRDPADGRSQSNDSATPLGSMDPGATRSMARESRQSDQQPQ